MKGVLRGSGLWLGLSLILAGIAVGVGITWAPRSTAPSPREQISIGTIFSERSALLWVARDLGLFRNAGLDVTVKVFEAGLLAAREVSAGNLDLATVEEFVVVNENLLLPKPDLKIIGMINRSDDIKIVARKDRGIAGVRDLAGKRVGVLLGSDADFFLTLFCVLNRLDRSALKVIDLNPSWQIEAINGGTADAICIWEPFASRAEKRLGPDAVSWSGHNEVPVSWVLVCTEQWAVRRPAAARSLLEALLAAEEFVRKNKDQAQQIVERRLRRPAPPHWWENSLSTVVLDRPLVLAMEDRARWIQATSPKAFPSFPNVLNFFDFGPLEAVKPERVTIIH